MIPMHYGTFRLGREPMDEPLPRLLRAAERAGVSESVVGLAEGESWMGSEDEREQLVPMAGAQDFRG
jgi:L-ascorbate metabolism protein UlaG (beta-lactamase superfamily)